MFFAVEWVTLRKNNMEPQNGDLEDEFPFQRDDFQVPAVNFESQWVSHSAQASGAKDGKDGSVENVAAMDASGAIGTDLKGCVSNFSLHGMASIHTPRGRL